MAVTKEKEETVSASSKAMRALNFWHAVTARALKELPFDLSARQNAILLNVYLLPPPHSVKSIAESLGISKPAICRALDVLEKSKLLKRQRDKDDKRNVMLQRTVKGSVYLSEFADIIIASTKN